MLGWLLAAALVGNAQPGAAVEVRPRAADEIVAQGKADASGRFRVEVPPGVYDVEIRERDDVRIARNAGVSAGSRSRAIERHPVEEHSRIVRIASGVPEARVSLWMQTIHFGGGEILLPTIAAILPCVSWTGTT